MAREGKEGLPRKLADFDRQQDRLVRDLYIRVAQGIMPMAGSRRFEDAPGDLIGFQAPRRGKSHTGLRMQYDLARLGPCAAARGIAPPKILDPVSNENRGDWPGWATFVCTPNRLGMA